MTIDELLAENKQLRAENAELKQRLADLDSRGAESQRATRSGVAGGKRQATPFSKGFPKAKPKKPGQKKGHRAAIAPHLIMWIESRGTVARDLPECAGPVLEDAVQVQYQEDIPRPVPTIVTQFNVHVGHCAQCQRRIQGRHPDRRRTRWARRRFRLARTRWGWLLK